MMEWKSVGVTIPIYEMESHNPFMFQTTTNQPLIPLNQNISHWYIPIISQFYPIKPLIVSDASVELFTSESDKIRTPGDQPE